MSFMASIVFGVKLIIMVHFFRSSGGKAQSFENQVTAQSEQVPDVGGKFTVSYSSKTPTGIYKKVTSGLLSNDGGNWVGAEYESKLSWGDPKYVEGGEVRPLNYTINVYKRVENGVSYNLPDGTIKREGYIEGKSTVIKEEYHESLDITQTYAWESFDGINYHYLFEGQTIPATLADDKTGNINLKLVTLTLGDVVLENHKIIPYEEDIGSRKPIGVLASLQAPSGYTKVPLRVLSYKEEAGLAWCSNEQDEGYNDVLAKPDSLNDMPCSLTGLDYFEYFKKTIYTDKGRTFDLYNFPIFKAASEMTDGGLTWYIPHYIECRGCIDNEVMYDLHTAKKINTGFEKIKKVLSEDDLSLYSPINDNKTYWTSIIASKKDIFITRDFTRDGTNEKKSTEPYTRFMAVLD